MVSNGQVPSLVPTNALAALSSLLIPIVSIPKDAARMAGTVPVPPMSHSDALLTWGAPEGYYSKEIRDKTRNKTDFVKLFGMQPQLTVTYSNAMPSSS